MLAANAQQIVSHSALAICERIAPDDASRLAASEWIFVGSIVLSTVGMTVLLFVLEPHAPVRWREDPLVRPSSGMEYRRDLLIRLPSSLVRRAAPTSGVIAGDMRDRVAMGAGCARRNAGLRYRHALHLHELALGVNGEIKLAGGDIRHGAGSGLSDGATTRWDGVGLFLAGRERRPRLHVDRNGDTGILDRQLVAGHSIFGCVRRALPCACTSVVAVDRRSDRRLSQRISR